MLSTGSTIYQSFVGSVEFVLAHFLLNYFRTGQTDTAFFVHNDNVGSSSYEAHTAEAANLGAYNCNNRQNAAAILDCVHNLSMSQQAGICFVQTDTAGFKGDSNQRTTSVIVISMSSFDVFSCFQSQAQGVNHFRTVNFADSTADEFAFHRNYEYRVLANQANTGYGAVIKLYCSTEYRQMRTFKAIMRSEQFGKGAFVAQTYSAFTGISIKEAAFFQFIPVFHLIQPPLRLLLPEPGAISCILR